MKEEIKRFVILNTEKYIVQNKPFVLNGEAAVWNGKNFLFAAVKEEDDFEFKPEEIIKNYLQQADFYQTAHLVVYDFYQYFHQQLFPNFEPKYEYVQYLIDKSLFSGAFVKTMLSILSRPDRYARRILLGRNLNKKRCKQKFFNMISYEISKVKSINGVNLLLANRYTFIFTLLFEIIYGYVQSKSNNDESFYRKYLEKIFSIEIIRD